MPGLKDECAASESVGRKLVSRAAKISAWLSTLPRSSTSSTKRLVSSIQLNDHLAVGAGPILDVSQLRLDPFVFVAPNADGTYPNGQHSPFHFGAGFQAGVFMTTDAGWNFGASVKSPQWFERFRYNAVDERGPPRLHPGGGRHP